MKFSFLPNPIEILIFLVGSAAMFLWVGLYHNELDPTLHNAGSILIVALTAGGIYTRIKRKKEKAAEEEHDMLDQS